MANPCTLNDDSTLTVPTAPGCGADVDEARLEEVTLERWQLRA